jgi:hypothetical protein
MGLAYQLYMSTLVMATRTRLDRSERLRLALLSGLSFVAGLTFLALLVADEARAVSF